MYKDEDIEMIHKAQSGDMRAFETVIMNYEKDIYNIAYRMFGNSHDAEDVSQEVCIKIFKNIKSYNDKSKFYTWIYKITVNTCIDELRRNKNDKNIIYIDQTINISDNDVEVQYKDDKEVTPEEAYIKKEEQKDLQDKINMLDPDQKAVIVLRYINGLEYEEIAESLECNLGTVKSRLNRAKKKLLEIFDKNKEHNARSVRLNNQKGGDLYESKR